MRKMLLATAAAALSLAMVGPVAAQQKPGFYTWKNVEYDLKSLRWHRKEPSTKLSAGTAIRVDEFKDGGGCEKGYFGIVIAAENEKSNRHRNCLKDLAG